MRKRIIIAGIILLISVATAGAGNHPLDVEWKELQTEHFTLIFPREIESEARRTAANLERTYSDMNGSLGVDTTEYKIILSNHGVESNGYVALVPKRSEWFGAPPQDSFAGPGSWFDLLASHEVRHMAQYDAVNNGFTKFMHVISGETGRAFVSNLALPAWVWEGDAVMTETALSHSGRGRQAKFARDIRTIALTDQWFSYHQALLGSYRRWYPNHYYLGYFLSLHIRSKYGDQAWEDIIKETGRLAFFPLTFEASVKRVTGESIDRLYKEAIRRWAADWRAQEDSLELTEPRLTVPRSRWDIWSSFEPVGVLEDGRIAAVKSSLKEISRVVLVDSEGHEKRVAGVGSVDGQYDLHGSHLVYSEFVADPLWGYRSYGEIVILDVESGRKTRLTEKSRYFSPVFSPDGNTIAVVYWGAEMKSEIRILDSATGEVLRTLAGRGNEALAQIRYTPDGEKIVCTSNGVGGKSLIEFDLSDGNRRELIGSAWNDIYDIEVSEGYIYFVSPYSGIDNIYALDRSTGESFQVTSRPYGTADPVVVGDDILYSDYTEKGFSLVFQTIRPEAWTPWADVPVWVSADQRAVVALENGPIFPAPGEDEAAVSGEEFEVTDTSPAAYGFNIHSWGIESIDVSSVRMGIQSKDIFDNWDLKAFGVFDFMDIDGFGGGSLSYNGLPVKLSMGVQAGKEQNFIKDGSSSNYYHRNDPGANQGAYTHVKGNLDLSLPLNFSRGVWGRGLNFSVGFMPQYYTQFEGDLYSGKEPFWSLGMNYGFSFVNQYALAKRDLVPRWKQALWANLAHDLFTPSKVRVSTGWEAIVPLWKNHSLIYQGAALYSNESGLESPRSFINGWWVGFSGMGNASFVADNGLSYLFPLFNTDFAVWHLLYIKRFYGQIFAGARINLYDDHSFRIEDTGLVFGGDLAMEFQVFNLPIPMHLGLRLGGGLDSFDRGKLMFFISPLFGATVSY